MVRLNELWLSMFCFLFRSPKDLSETYGLHGNASMANALSWSPCIVVLAVYASTVLSCSPCFASRTETINQLLKSSTDLVISNRSIQMLKHAIYRKNSPLRVAKEAKNVPNYTYFPLKMKNARSQKNVSSRTPIKHLFFYLIIIWLMKHFQQTDQHSNCRFH